MPHADTWNQRGARIAFGLGMTSVGILTLVYGPSVLLVKPLPPWVPAGGSLGYFAGALMVLTGIGLLSDHTVRLSIGILLPLLVAWLLVRVRMPVADPGREINWFFAGVAGVPTAAALVLFARYASPRPGSWFAMAGPLSVRIAWLLFGLSVPTFGLSHFFEFAARTVSLVPAWLPFRTGWAYLAGAGQVAAGLGVLFRVYPRLAATAEATMLGMFAVLVWVPAVIGNPGLQSNWVEFLVTFALAGASWVVAGSIPGGRPPRRSA